MAAGTTHSFHGVSLDISQGGLGALVTGCPGIGETVQIELRLRRAILRTGAIVRHKSQARAGFEFLRLGQAERTKISEITGCA
jgi:c-di-GMP-binding flagellar brake protein YcgR